MVNMDHDPESIYVLLTFPHSISQYISHVSDILQQHVWNNQKPLCNVYFLLLGFSSWPKVSSRPKTANAYFLPSLNLETQLTLLIDQLPSDPCWPSTEEWSSLNETVSGRLIHTVPLASVCYPSEPNYDTDACESVPSHWISLAFHAADPASAGDLT